VAKIQIRVDKFERVMVIFIIIIRISWSGGGAQEGLSLKSQRICSRVCVCIINARVSAGPECE
jgi:hypothetical protein